jgi:hypothetical protein
MSTTSELVERLRDIAGWTAIIEQHRRKTDDPSITYVLKDGTRIHEDDSYVAKLAATLSRALEDTADISKAAAARLDELERENAALRGKPGMMLSLSLNAPSGIYTASKTRHAHIWQQYRSDGYPIISSWIDEARPGETQDHNDLWTRCIRESQMCAAMVVYREADDVLKGAWLEMGVALGAGIPVFAVGCRDFTIGKSGLLIHCDTVDDAMRRAAALAGSGT